MTGIDAGTSLVKFNYTYWDNENNIRRKIFDHRSGDPYNEYSYDDIDRVTGITYLDSDTESFVMDDLGNRDGSQTLRDGSSDTYSVDTTTNRYSSIDSATLDYDTSGNLTQDKDGYVHIYDYKNRVVKIKDVNNVLVAEFDYDTQGRRVKVYDAVADETTLYYYSNSWQVLSEYDDLNNQQAYYVFGNYIDETLLMHRDSADKFYLHDHLYSPVALLDNSGSVVERYEYDAYGKTTVWNAGITTTYIVSQHENSYLFTGRRLDIIDSGSLKIYHYRARAYDPQTGRFMQHDPLGIDLGSLFLPKLQYEDGLCLYAFMKSNVHIYYDLYGTSVAPNCCRKVVNKLNSGSLKTLYDEAKKATDMNDKPCLKKITCTICNDPNWAGEYSPSTRTITICSDNVTPAAITNTLRHELIHAIQCDPGRNCSHCMRMEYQAYYYGGQCGAATNPGSIIDAAMCIKKAWGSCSHKSFCQGKTWTDYLFLIGQYGWPPEYPSPPRER